MKKPAVAELEIVVSKDVNPDLSGRPSPVIVRIYELKSLAAFNTANVFALLERDKEVLGADLIGREELPMQPGERRELKKTLQGETRYLGVTAAYRDIERAKWRATAPAPPHELTQLEVRVHRADVSIAVRSASTDGTINAVER